MIEQNINDYIQNLTLAEKQEKTIKQYVRFIEEFCKEENIKAKDDITKEKIIDYKKKMESKYKIKTVNIKIIVLNNFISFLGFDSNYKVKVLKEQFKNTIENTLSLSDYERLLRTALNKNKITMYYLMRVLKETGIRVSELKHITVEAVKVKKAVFNSKGTHRREAFIPKALQKDLLKYCQENNITEGIIFKSKSGNPLDSAYIYKEIQYISGQARVRKDKAHPHSFRHLFAKEYLKNEKHNLVDLKNLLGHKSLSTTEIYLAKSGQELGATLED
jgi:site-specific recombinase XerD